MKIQFQNVSKSFRIRIQNGLKGFIRPDFREVQALSDLSFSIDGGIVGLIGENGAGKSTTIKLLTGILNPTEGEVKVLGVNPFLHRKDLMKRVGVIFGQRSLLKGTLPVKFTYDWLKDIYGVPKTEYQQKLSELSELFGISELINRPPRELSLGQRRRCDLVAALLHSPEVLLLDEPTIGLDYKVKSTFRTLIRDYVEKHKITVLISSHDLTELENMCDSYIILSNGKKILSGTFEKLTQELGLTNMAEFTIEEPQEPIKLDYDLKYDAGVLRIFYTDGLEKIIKTVYENYEVTDVKIVKNSLQKLLEG